MTVSKQTLGLSLLLSGLVLGPFSSWLYTVSTFLSQVAPYASIVYLYAVGVPMTYSLYKWCELNLHEEEIVEYDSKTDESSINAYHIISRALIFSGITVFIAWVTMVLNTIQQTRLLSNFIYIMRKTTPTI